MFKRAKEFLKSAKSKIKGFYTEGETLHITIKLFLSIAITFFLLCALVLGLFVVQPENYNMGFTTKDLLNLFQAVSVAALVLTGAATAAVGYRLQSIKEVDATNKRFGEAVKNMCYQDKDNPDSESALFIRIEGIYALERLAFNAPNNKERQRVMDILCTYLRTVRSVDRFDEVMDDKEMIMASSKLRLSEDHEMVTKVIMRIRERYTDLEVDLSFVNLYGISFFGANFRNVDFSFSQFKSVYFGKAQLQGANFFEVEFKRVDFYNAIVDEHTCLNFEELGYIIDTSNPDEWRLRRRNTSEPNQGGGDE